MIANSKYTLPSDLPLRCFALLAMHHGGTKSMGGLRPPTVTNAVRLRNNRAVVPMVCYIELVCFDVLHNMHRGMNEVNTTEVRLLFDKQCALRRIAMLASLNKAAQSHIIHIALLHIWLLCLSLYSCFALVL